METMALLAGTVAALISGLIGIACYVIAVIGMWKMFTKAGVDGWKAIIPILNIYELYKMSWNRNYFWAALILTIVGRGVSSSENGFFAFIGTICLIGAFILNVLLYNHLSKSFGQGIGFTVGLLLLPIIFFPILGFGSAQYEGNLSGASSAEYAPYKDVTPVNNDDVIDAETVPYTAPDVTPDSADTSSETNKDPLAPSDSNF